MTTVVQIEANRRNAKSSTGPATPEGKASSSRNAESHGLFAVGNLIRPGENGEFNQLAQTLRRELAPEGILEQVLTAEITRMAWRLRRCAQAEDSIAHFELDPMATPDASTTQIAVDRARLGTHRLLKRSMDELRRLQNERRFRIEILAEGFNTDELGLASYKDLMPAMVAERRRLLLDRQLEDLGSFESIIAGAGRPQTPATKQSQSAPVNPVPDLTKQTHFSSGTARNAPCPCGSGQKHKRCCGKNAAPVLCSSAA